MAEAKAPNPSWIDDLEPGDMLILMKARANRNEPKCFSLHSRTTDGDGVYCRTVRVEDLPGSDAGLNPL